MSSSALTATPDDKNRLIVHLEGDAKAPGNIVVQYWSDQNGPFITEGAPTPDGRFSVDIMRLRASTLYNYEVFLLTSANAPVSVFQGSFTTGQLPRRFRISKSKATRGHRLGTSCCWTTTPLISTAWWPSMEMGR